MILRFYVKRMSIVEADLAVLSVTFLREKWLSVQQSLFHWRTRRTLGRRTNELSTVAE